MAHARLLLILLFYFLLLLLVHAQNVTLPNSSLSPRQNNAVVLMGKMPLVQRIRAICSMDGMEVLLNFDQPFTGVIYSKGFYRASSPECSYARTGTNQTQYQFRIPAASCGTRSGMDTPENNSAPVKYFENTIIIQNEPDLQEVWDTARTLRCTWRTRMEQTVQFSPLNVNMLEAQTVQFGAADDNATVAMAIQNGQGPFAPILQPNQLLKIGDPLTLVMYVRAAPSTMDVSVRDCYATDGRGRAQLQLTSTDGCLLQPKLLGLWQTTRDTGNTGANVIVYAFMNTFKFPDDMELNVRCNIAICKDGCAGNCNQTRGDDSLLLELQKTSVLQNGPPTDGDEENGKLNGGRRRTTTATTATEATTSTSLLEVQNVSLLQNGPPTEDSEEDARLKEARRHSTTTLAPPEIVTFTSSTSSTEDQSLLLELDKISSLQNGPPTDDSEEDARLNAARRRSTTTLAPPEVVTFFMSSTPPDQSLLLELQKTSLLQNGPPTDDGEEDARLNAGRHRSTTPPPTSTESETTSPPTSTSQPDTMMMNMNGMHPYHPRNPNHLVLPPSPYQSASLQDLIITPNKYEYVSSNLVPSQAVAGSAVDPYFTSINGASTASAAENRPRSLREHNGQQILRRQYLALLNEQQQIYGAGNINNPQTRSLNRPYRQFSLLGPELSPRTNQLLITHGLWNNGQGTLSTSHRIVKRSVGYQQSVYAHPLQSNRTGVLNLSGRLIVSTPEQIAQAAHDLAISDVAATPSSAALKDTRENVAGMKCISTATFYIGFCTVIGLLVLLLALLLAIMLSIWRKRHHSDTAQPFMWFLNKEKAEVDGVAEVSQKRESTESVDVWHFASNINSGTTLTSCKPLSTRSLRQ